MKPDAGYGWYGGDYDLGRLGRRNQMILSCLIHQAMFESGHRLKAKTKANIPRKNKIRR